MHFRQVSTILPVLLSTSERLRILNNLPFLPLFVSPTTLVMHDQFGHLHHSVWLWKPSDYNSRILLVPGSLFRLSESCLSLLRASFLDFDLRAPIPTVTVTVLVMGYGMGAFSLYTVTVTVMGT